MILPFSELSAVDVPASTGITDPVTYRASSETSQAIAFETSIGSTASTGMAFSSDPASCGTFSTISATFPPPAIGVRTVVGATLLTRMKCGASELAHDRVKPMTPCFAAV